MSTIFKSLLLLLTLTCITSCRDDIVKPNSREEVFQSFWDIMNRRYIYFEEKKINWDSIYTVYYPQAKATKSDDELLKIINEIIVQFKDRHLCLLKNTKKGYSYFLPTDSINYVIHNYMSQYNFIPLSIYNGKAYRTYQHQLHHYAYMNYSSFLTPFDEELFLANLKKLQYQEGLILDLRENQGGFIDYLLPFVSMFYNGNKVVFQTSSKQSSNKNDFGPLVPFSYPGKNIIPDSIPIIVLTRSKTYSCANLCSYMLRELTNCYTVGSTTGGGGGSPHYEYLPNGWILGFPFIKAYSAKGANTEYGLKPDFPVKYNSTKDTTDYPLIKAINVLDSINHFEKENL